MFQSRLFDVGSNIATPANSASEGKLQRVALPEVFAFYIYLSNLDSLIRSIYVRSVFFIIIGIIDQLLKGFD